uniref:TPR_REGION domain-containing protein n=1 Tax=Globodera pallida TaxID=36090 RepID=A0A183CN03_GLOPA
MSSKRDKNVVNLILNPTLPFGIEQREEANESKSDDEEKCSKLPNYRQSEELSLEEALHDLEKALELCGAKGRTAAQSFVQKALIHQFRGEEAMAKAAKLGSKFAKNQLIAMNPYAAMCNKMLGEMMSKFRREEH